jgi:hypothetical protein
MLRPILLAAVCIAGGILLVAPLGHAWPAPEVMHPAAGKVVAFFEPSEKTRGHWGAKYEYDVDGVRQIGLAESASPFHVGQPLAVVYDPSDPSTSYAASADEDVSRAAYAAWREHYRDGRTFAIVAGLVLIVGGVVISMSDMRHHRRGTRRASGSSAAE